MRLEAECPGCGAVVKQETTTGRFDYHRWANGCDVTEIEGYSPLAGIRPSARARRDDELPLAQHRPTPTSPWPVDPETGEPAELAESLP